MATSHYCHGKWRDGPVSACPKHKQLAKKQSPVVANPEHRGGVVNPPKASSPKASSSEGSSSSSSSSSGSSSSSSSSGSD